MTKKSVALVEEPVEVAVSGNGIDDGLIHYNRGRSPDAHFSLPKHMSVRQQLEYYSRYYDDRNQPLYLRLWSSARTVIQNWKCEALPDKDEPLENLTDPDVAVIIIWAGQTVLDYMGTLEAIPKVS